MADAFSFTTSYVLDKAHFNECFSQSVGDTTVLRDYYKALALIAAGVLLVLLSHFEPYLSWFIFALGVVEAVSVYFRKPWWVYRQLLGKSGNAEVSLTIDEQGLKIASFHVNSTLEWQAVSALTATPKGWLVQHNGGKSYISNSCLSVQAQSFITEKAQQRR